MAITLQDELWGASGGNEQTVHEIHTPVLRIDTHSKRVLGGLVTASYLSSASSGPLLVDSPSLSVELS